MEKDSKLADDCRAAGKLHGLRAQRAALALEPPPRIGVAGVELHDHLDVAAVLSILIANLGDGSRWVTPGRAKYAAKLAI